MQHFMSLRDALHRPLRNLRLSVTDRCNLRCEYCMPEEEYTWLPREDVLQFEEISALVDVFLALGVDNVRLTGGEPLLRRDLPALVRMLAVKPDLADLALTTNGVLLADHAGALAAAGLRRVTVSLDTLRADRFRALTRFDELDRVKEGLAAAARTWSAIPDAEDILTARGAPPPRAEDLSCSRGVPPPLVRAAGAALERRLSRSAATAVKIDTVVIKGVNDDELGALIEYGKTLAAEVRFIEYMDVGGATRWSAARVVSRRDMLDAMSRRYGAIEPLVENSSAPAERFRLPDGTVFGIISSTTAPFCRSCDRSRLTADGMWYLCLYAATGIDLRAPLRRGASIEELQAVIAGGWKSRADRGAEQRLELGDRRAFVPVKALRKDPHLEMHTRGG
jgi:cyclic pyranopterin phosphate synthase